MLDFPDPVSDVLGLFLKKAMDSKIFQYTVLVLEMGIASTIAGLTACGASLLAKQPVAWSIGAGMAGAAIALLATFTASPSSKGLMIRLPEQTSANELDTSMTTITRSTK